MKRRAQGEGSVFFDSSRGRWVGVTEARPDPLTGNRRRVKVVGAEGEGKAAVAKRLRARMEEIRSAGATAGTVEELVESWLNRRAPKRKGPGALDTARRLVNSHILPAFGSVKVGELRVEDVER